MPRPSTVAGLRVGVLDNAKWEAGRPLGWTVTLLNEVGEVRRYRKESFSWNATPELIARIAAENDLALVAVGDRGSCTSCCMHDATSLEARGVPTAAIVNSEFLQEARLQLEALGMPGLPPVVIAHPLSTLHDDGSAWRAAEAAPQVRRVWLGQEPGGRGRAKPAGLGSAEEMRA